MFITLWLKKNLLSCHLTAIEVAGYATSANIPPKNLSVVPYWNGWFDF